MFRTRIDKLKIRTVRDIRHLAVRIHQAVLKDMTRSSMYCPVAENGEVGTHYLTKCVCNIFFKR